MHVRFQFRPLQAASARPLRAWTLPAAPTVSIATRTKTTSVPAAPLADEPGLDPDLLLEAGDPAAEPDTLLGRPTLTGLNEQALLHALNSRDLANLQDFTGFGPKVAAKIIEFREREKFFTSLDELVRVPLIGPTRFRKLVGRESFFFTLPLHSALRLPPSQNIRTGDLQPLAWPAPGLPRLLLAPPGGRDAERRVATLSRWHLHERRVGPASLFVHTLVPVPESRAAFLLQTLPRLLRLRLNPAASS